MLGGKPAVHAAKRRKGRLAELQTVMAHLGCQLDGTWNQLKARLGAAVRNVAGRINRSGKAHLNVRCTSR